MTLTDQEVVETFMNTMLEGDYNFLKEDLVKLANAFVTAAAPKIMQAERQACVDAARSLNGLVADKIEEIRNRA